MGHLNIRTIYVLFFIFYLIFYSLIILAPYFSYLYSITNFLPYKLISDTIYLIFSIMCHQLPQRSYFIFGYKMAVCARCFGIYTGMLIGTIIYPFIKKLSDFKIPNIKYYIISLIPMAIDGTTQLIGLRESFNELRFITGFIAGFVSIFYFLPIFLNFINKLIR